MTDVRSLKQYLLVRNPTHHALSIYDETKFLTYNGSLSFLLSRCGIISIVNNIIVCVVHGKIGLALSLLGLDVFTVCAY